MISALQTLAFVWAINACKNPCSVSQIVRRLGMTKRTIELVGQLNKLGFTTEEALKLRRIEMTLRRWFEYECGTGDDRVTRSIERDEQMQKPFMRVQYMAGSQWVDRKHPIADREAGARKRLAAIMAPRRRKLIAYVQGDPRGSASGEHEAWQCPECGQPHLGQTAAAECCAECFELETQED